MRDILSSSETWRAQGEQIALGAVIETWGSAPRQVGSKLAATLSGGIAGFVSAGCVEHAVIEVALMLEGDRSPNQKGTSYPLLTHLPLSFGTRF